jgi:O-antigen ligase
VKPRRLLVGFLLLYVFLTVTALHQESTLLSSWHLELVLVSGSLIFALGAFWRGKLPWRDNQQALLLIALALIAAPLASAVAGRSGFELLDLDEYRDWIKALLVVPMLYAAFTTRRQREFLLDGFLLGQVVLALIFLYHFYILGEAREYDLRPTLNTKYGDPNFLCTFFAVALPLAIYRWKNPRKGWRLFYGAVVLLLGGCALITESRMGLVSIAVAAVYLVISYRPSGPALRRLVFMGLLAIGLVSFDARRLAHRFTHVDDESNAGRVRSYRNGWVLFARRPWFGNGWDYSPREFYENAGYPWFQSESKRLAVHDTPLQILADLGLYGFIAYGLLLSFVGRKIWDARRRNRELAAGAMASLIAFALNFLTLPLETKDFAILFLAVLATLVPRVRDPITGFR